MQRQFRIRYMEDRKEEEEGEEQEQEQEMLKIIYNTQKSSRIGHLLDTPREVVLVCFHFSILRCMCMFTQILAQAAREKYMLQLHCDFLDRLCLGLKGILTKEDASFPPANDSSRHLQ